MYDESMTMTEKLTYAALLAIVSVLAGMWIVAPYALEGFYRLAGMVVRPLTKLAYWVTFGKVVSINNYDYRYSYVGVHHRHA